MAVKENFNREIQDTEEKLKKLSYDMKRLDLEYQHLMDSLKLSPLQLKQYVENPKNFSAPIWEQLQAEKKKLDEKLTLELNNVPNVDKTKKTYSDRGSVQQHWLFVR